MPGFLGTILQSLFVALSDFFVRFVSKRAAKVIAGVGIMVSLTATFVTAVMAALNGLSTVAPSWLVIAWGWFMPSNAVGCASAYVAIYAARWVYDQNNNYQTTLFK